MAAPSTFQPMKEQEAINCEPCLKGDKEVLAVGFCSKCLEYYCESCSQTHKFSAATEGHLICKGDEFPSSRLDKVFAYSKCRLHDEMPKVWFCTNHNTLICFACAETGHSKCTTMLITKACKIFPPDYEKPVFHKAVRKLGKATETLKRSKKQQLDSLDAQKDRNLKEGKEFRAKVLEALDRSYVAFEDEHLRKYTEWKKSLLEDKTVAENLESELGLRRESLRQQEAGRTSDIERFLNWYGAADQINEFREKLVKIDKTKYNLKCKFNSELVTKKNFGDVTLKRQKSGCVIS